MAVCLQDLKMRSCFLSLSAIERSISTIYPKSRFCTKRNKRLDFQGFSGISEPFARKTEKGNCKFEPQKCKSVFKVCVWCIVISQTTFSAIASCSDEQELPAVFFSLSLDHLFDLRARVTVHYLLIFLSSFYSTIRCRTIPCRWPSKSKAQYS